MVSRLTHRILIYICGGRNGQLISLSLILSPLLLIKHDFTLILSLCVLVEVRMPRLEVEDTHMESGDGVWVPGRTGVPRLGSHVFTL